MFSKTTEYALRATFYIAQKSSENNKLSIHEIAKAIGSPRPFTAKILQTLAKENTIISSVRGPNGGFFMTERARKQPIIAVLTVMNEQRTLTKCVLGLRQCGFDNPCPMHHRYSRVKPQIIEMFENTTIEEVAKGLEPYTYYLPSSEKKKSGK